MAPIPPLPVEHQLEIDLIQQLMDGLYKLGKKLDSVVIDGYTYTLEPATEDELAQIRAKLGITLSEDHQS